MVREDLARCWFYLCIPRKVTTYGDVKAAIARE
jgi:hypothetical protein